MFKIYYISLKVNELAPGQRLMFNIDAYDELNHSVYSVPVASAVNSTIQLNQLYYIAQPHSLQNMSLKYSATPAYYYQMKEGKSFHQTIRFVDSTSSFPSDANITIKTVKCYPGFLYQNGSCVCNSSDKNIVR